MKIVYDRKNTHYELEIKDRVIVGTTMILCTTLLASRYIKRAQKQHLKNKRK